jgi:predicted peptidase
MKPLSKIFALCLMAPLSAFTQVKLAEKYSTYSENVYQSMAYGFFKPAGADPQKKYPLIVYLHGSNDLVSRDLIWYQTETQKQFPAFVITPKCKETNQGWGNTWNSTHTEATWKTLALVDSLVKAYNIDTTRLYLYGISMGGFGVFSILEKEPGKFAGAYAVCGGSDTKAASKLLNTPLWIFHGDSDDVVPVRLSRDVYQEMIRLGGKKVKYTEYAGVKHNSWENVAQEKSLPSWLFAQLKGK